MARRFRDQGKIDGNAFERGCEGKATYPTEAAAVAGLKFLQKQGSLRTNAGLVVYRCTFCQEWHFGH